LREQHADKLTSDVTDLLWSFLGSALHVVLERGQTTNHLTEERLYADMDGVTISGAIDLQKIHKGRVTIIDYKMVKAWSVMNDKIEWEQQLNIYRWLVETGKKQHVESLQICAIIRDFDKYDKRENYPAAPIHMIDIPMWDLDYTEQFIRERLELHREAKVSQDFGEALPQCTAEERWMSETTYAVKREGRKTAIRVFKSIEEANELATKEKGYVETRAGEPRRCTGNFCNVNQWCDQYVNTGTGTAEA
jgi:hypothetical protein